jgi:hypothetical protein
MKLKNIFDTPELREFFDLRWAVIRKNHPKKEPSIHPELMYPDLCQLIYSGYLNGQSIEFIKRSLYCDPRTNIGGEWEEMSLTFDNINEIIDFYNELNNI